MTELSREQTAQIALATSAFGPVPNTYVQPQMGYTMNYGGASDTGFKGTLEHGARAFQSERVAERFTPYPGTGTSTGYGVTFMRPTNEKGIPLDKGDKNYEYIHNGRG